LPPPPSDAIVIESDFVPFPLALVAFTVKLNVLAVVGFPEITPAEESVKPLGKSPLSLLHVMGVSPLATSVWLYAVPTVPPGNVAVVIVGAVPSPPLSLVYAPFTLLSHVWFESVSVVPDSVKLPLAVPKLDSLKVMVEPETENVPEYCVVPLTL
jgi:hypothetical protein